jgi:hypothetical protein
VDCARELGLDESVVSRRIARLSFLGLVRVDENGRIYLCGVVIPPPELAKDDSMDGTLPPTLQRAAESMDPQESQALQDCLRAWKADRQSQLADVVRKVRKQSDEDLVRIMATFGFRKQPRGWIRLPATSKEVAVQTSTSPDAPGEEVAVQASNGQSARPADGHDADEADVASQAGNGRERVASGRTDVSPRARAIQQVSAEVQQGNAPLTATIPAVNNKPILINRPIDSGDQLDQAVSSSSALFIKNKKCDDEDKRTPLEQPKYVTELDELVAEIRSSTGITEDQGLIRGIVENLELRGGTLRDFLDWVKPRARRLKDRARPGFYLSEARKWGSSRNQPALDPRLASPTCPPVGGKCQVCGGFGRLSDGGYCQCSMGRDLERVEKRMKEKSASA